MIFFFLHKICQIFCWRNSLILWRLLKRTTLTAGKELYLARSDFRTGLMRTWQDTFADYSSCFCTLRCNMTNMNDRSILCIVGRNVHNCILLKKIKRIKMIHS